MGKGKRYENQIVNSIERTTNTHINAYAIGYSGSHATAAADVLVTDGQSGQNYALELKNSSAQNIYIDGDELDALVERRNDNTVVALVAKFARREPLVVLYSDQLYGLDSDVAYDEKTVPEKFAFLAHEAFRPRVTDSSNLGLSKPSTDDWPSAQNGSADEDAILSGLGVATSQSFAVSGL